MTDTLARLQAGLSERYIIERELGRGGMAVVFLAKDVKHDREVAIKVLHAELAAAIGADRFVREIRIAARLSHPNILPLHDSGECDGILYYVMPYVTGQTLRERLREREQLRLEEVVTLAREVGDALDFAHAAGIVHRDIKPENIMLAGGHAVVTDFGIARAANEAATPQAGGVLTHTGMIVGTPVYMSPEQAAGDPGLGGRSDQYALACVIYELLAGQPPFHGMTTQQVIVAHITEPPPPIESKREGLPPTVGIALNRALAKAPESRFDGCRAFADALVTDTGETLPTLRTLRAHRKSRRLAYQIGGVVAAVAAIAIGVLTMRGRNTPVANTLAAVPEGMVAIPAGHYRIGRDDGPSISRPAHEVTLPSFAIGRDEVTVQQYAEFVKANAAVAPWTRMPEPALPVTRVNADEAAAFCAWKYKSGRLPSEEEWEATARGSTAYRFPWGDVWRSGAANTAGAHLGSPVATGSFLTGATATGVRDLSGNVWEWTSSNLVAYEGGSAPANAGQYVAIRGGAFNTPDSLATATQRGYLPPTSGDRSMYAATGFRCAMPLPSDAKLRVDR